MKIKVMPDFCSSGIWNAAGGGMIEYEDLKMPNDLIKDFEAWIDYYDKSWDKNYSKPNPIRAKNFNRVGKELAQRLKNLHTNLEIYYVGENEDCKSSKPVLIREQLGYGA